MLKMKPEDIVAECDRDCESENYHDRVGLASGLFEDVKHLVKPKDRKELAELIAGAIRP